MMTGSEPSVVLVRRVKASAHDIYNAWLVPDLIGKWMKPGPEWAIMAETDPRMGGVYSIVSIDGSGVAETSSGKYRDLAPGRRIFMTWNYDGPHAALKGIETLVAVDLRSVEPDVTQVTMTHSRLTSEAMRDRYREGWTGCFDRMDAMFAANDKGPFG